MDGELNELRKEFKDKKQELTKQRSQLYSLNSQKEEFFKELKSSREKVKIILSQIRSLKKERDQFTKQVRETKEERNKLNLAVKKKSSAKKEVDQKKKEFFQKSNLQESPSKLRAMIKSMEEKIETEVIPFSKEKEITKQIKELKAQLNQIKELDDTLKTINTASLDFAETRKKAEASHQKVQEFANKSQEKHEQINKLYEQLRKIRDTEKPLAKKHLDSKVQYNQLKQSLEKVSLRVNELSKLFGEEKRKSVKSQIREKTAEVQEKIKKRQKLSMEDILAFQASDE